MTVRAYLFQQFLQVVNSSVHCYYNYNVTDKCGVFEGWSLIVGDIGGKAECEEVLLVVCVFLGRRNEECYLS